MFFSFEKGDDTVYISLYLVRKIIVNPLDKFGILTVTFIFSNGEPERHYLTPREYNELLKLITPMELVSVINTSTQEN